MNDLKNNSVQELILQIRAINETIADKLLVLFKNAKEQDITSPGIRIDSLRSFYCFLQKYPIVAPLNISLTTNDNIYVTYGNGMFRECREFKGKKE